MVTTFSWWLNFLTAALNFIVLRLRNRISLLILLLIEWIKWLIIPVRYHFWFPELILLWLDYFLTSWRLNLTLPRLIAKISWELLLLYRSSSVSCTQWCLRNLCTLDVDWSSYSTCQPLWLNSTLRGFLSVQFLIHCFWGVSHWRLVAWHSGFTSVIILCWLTHRWCHCDLGTMSLASGRAPAAGRRPWVCRFGFSRYCSIINSLPSWNDRFDAANFV